MFTPDPLCAHLTRCAPCIYEISVYLISSCEAPFRLGIFGDVHAQKFFPDRCPPQILARSQQLEPIAICGSAPRCRAPGKTSDTPGLGNGPHIPTSCDRRCT